MSEISFAFSCFFTYFCLFTFPGFPFTLIIKLFIVFYRMAKNRRAEGSWEFAARWVSHNSQQTRRTSSSLGLSRKSVSFIAGWCTSVSVRMSVCVQGNSKILLQTLVPGKEKMTIQTWLLIRIKIEITFNLRLHCHPVQLVVLFPASC